jgi:hypothetical protein
MSRIEVPIVGRILWATGDVLLRAPLSLRLRTAAGTWQTRIFLADPGAEITTMSAYEARLIGLPIPQKAAAGVAHRQSGLEVRSGYLRVQVVGMDPTEYAFPCFFLGDPTTTPGAGGPTASRRLLGLSGVIDKIQLAFNGRPAAGAPYGNLIVEKL